MKFRHIIWSIVKTLFRILWKLLLLALWGCSEFLAVACRAVADSLKNYINQKQK